MLKTPPKTKHSNYYQKNKEKRRMQSQEYHAKERYKAYRRRKAQIKLNTTKEGILNLTTGRISKYRTNAERQKAYHERKKLNQLK